VGVVLLVLGRVVDADEADEKDDVADNAEASSLTATVDSTDPAVSAAASGTGPLPLDSSRKDARRGLRYGSDETGSASVRFDSCGFVSAC
jgi:hypothetical protein